MKILYLSLKKKWFDMILSGEKKEEYREIKPYWTNRISYLPLPEIESHVPTNKEPNWKKKKYFGRG